MQREGNIHNLTETVGNVQELDYIRKLIRKHRWVFAKTYAAFCPHEYTLRKEWKDDTEYVDLVAFVWRNGLDAWYGKKTHANRYWFDHEEGYYYFVFPEDTDEEGKVAPGSVLINRARICDFDFWKDEVNEIVRCAPKRKIWD